MKKNHALLIQRICVFLGIGLLAVSVATLGLWRWNVYSSEKQGQRYIETMKSLLPTLQDAVPEERRDNTMSVLSIDGTSFVGMIELPRYNSTLPVCADWGKTSKLPCRFDGSIYNGTLKIGATTQKGQYDFYRALSLGDTVIYTDAEGNRYTLKITALRTEKHADQEALCREEADLTLFIKNVYSFEYLIVFCNAL